MDMIIRSIKEQLTKEIQDMIIEKCLSEFNKDLSYSNIVHALVSYYFKEFNVNTATVDTLLMRDTTDTIAIPPPPQDKITLSELLRKPPNTKSIICGDTTKTHTHHTAAGGGVSNIKNNTAASTISTTVAPQQYNSISDMNYIARCSVKTSYPPPLPPVHTMFNRFNAPTSNNPQNPIDISKYQFCSEQQNVSVCNESFSDDGGDSIPDDTDNIHNTGWHNMEISGKAYLDSGGTSSANKQLSIEYPLNIPEPIINNWYVGSVPNNIETLR